jgi:hypothetical protein
VVVDGGRGVRIVGCTICNTGGWGIRLQGMEHAVVGCDMDRLGEGGVSVSGGDRARLTPSQCVVENNHIHHFGRIFRTYRPAVSVDGVGCRVASNLIHDGPHNAIQLHGNDHRIELNEIHHVCYETGDVGAFYMGRDWSEQGNVLRWNFFHHIQGPGLHGAMAVYLDDAASGATVFGNVFYKAGRAAFIGGGRDNRIENNIFVDCEPAVHVDARGLNWMRNHIEDDMPKKLRSWPYQQSPWKDRYPALVRLFDDEPGAPKGNVAARNICVGGRWRDVEAAAKPLVKFEDNLLDADPRFISSSTMNFQIRDDSPAFRLGFERIPFERIGLIPDARRATWPVAASPRKE